jgi:hypothetical protein
VRTHPGAEVWTAREAAVATVLLRKHFGEPDRQGGDRIWTGVPGFVEVRIVDSKDAVRATREMVLDLAVPKSVKVEVAGGFVIARGETLDHCAATLHYLDEMARAGSKVIVSKLRRRIQGRVLPCWHRRLA